MNTLLVFFALPIATIIISIALQKILKCPPLVAGIVFSIFLIVTFIINNLFFLVAAIVYAILAFITAALVCLFSRFLCQNQDNDTCTRRGEDRGNQRRERRTCECNCGCHNDNENDTSNQLLTINSSCGNLENGNLLTISSNGCNGGTNELLTISNNCNGNLNNGCGGNNGNNNNCPNNNAIAARINVIPNVNNNGRTGCLCGQYRRR